MCLVPTKNWVKRKLLYTLTVKNSFSPVKPFRFLFYLQLFYTSHTILTHSSHTLTNITHSLEAQLWPLTNKRELYAGEFPPLFKFYLSSTTSPHLWSTHLRPAVTLPHVGEAIPASNISDPSPAKPSSQIHPQSLTLSSSSHQLYHVYVMNKCFYFDFWLC